VIEMTLSTLRGEREGPGPEGREGEVGAGEGARIPPPHLTSPLPGAERNVGQQRYSKCRMS
jgi:hypothetical protein